MFVYAVKFLFVAGSLAWTVTNTQRRALYDNDQREGYLAERPSCTRNTDMAAVAKWWAAHHDAFVENVTRKRPFLPSNARMKAQEAEIASAEWARLNDTAIDCEDAIRDKNYPDCARNVTATFAEAMDVPDLATDQDFSAYVKTGILVDQRSVKHAVACRYVPNDVGDTSRYRVIINANYANQPRCCTAKRVEEGSDAAPFKADEKEALDAGIAINQVIERGVTFDSFLGIVFSKIQPEEGRCSHASPCPLVVEVPGAANVPWLLLQRWCSQCGEQLGVFLISVDATEDTSAAFATNVFVPLVVDFIDKNPVDKSKVYLVAASRGCEIAMLAALTYPTIFTYAIMAGKFLFTYDLHEAMANAKSVSLQAGDDVRLTAIELHVGWKDKVHSQDQDFFPTLLADSDLFPESTQLTIRLYAGAEHQVWYAAWNAFHDVLWTGIHNAKDFTHAVPLTCLPSA